VFNVKELPVNEFAASLGLLGTPKIKFLNKRQKDTRQGVPVEQNAADEEHDDQSSSDTGNEDDIDKGHDSGEEGRGESNVSIATICFFDVAI
jgi:ATP-dependent RNA helicase DDX10/DBP4